MGVGWRSSTKEVPLEDRLEGDPLLWRLRVQLLRHACREHLFHPPLASLGVVLLWESRTTSYGRYPVIADDKAYFLGQPLHLVEGELVLRAEGALAEAVSANV